MGQLNTDGNKRIVRNALFLYVRMAFVLIVSLYTTRVVLQVLGVNDFGIFNVVCGFVSMFGFLNTSLSNAIQRFYNYEIGKSGKESVSKVYSCAIIIQVLLVIVVAILLETFGLWYINNKLVVDATRLVAANWIFQFAVVQMIFIILSVPYSAAVLAYEKMDYYAIVSVLGVILKLIIVIALQYINADKLIFYGVLLVLMSLLDFSMYSIYAKIRFKELRFTTKVSMSEIKSILSFTGWNVFGSFAYLLKNQGSAIVLNSFFGTAINAAFGISNQVMAAIKNFSLNLITAFRPQLVEAYARGDYSRTTKMFYSMTKVTYIFLFAISLPIICEIEQVLKIWLGDYPDYTVSLTVLSIICMLFSNLNTPVAQMVLAIGKLKEFQIVTSSLICMIIPFSWICFHYGLNPNWIYIVSIIIVIVNQIANLIILRKIYNFEYFEYFKDAIMPCLYATILSPIVPLLIVILMPSTTMRLIITFLSSIIFTAIITYSLCLNCSEKQILKKWVSSINRK